MDIHPQTAAGLGIDDGEWVLIERPEAIRQRAHFNEGIRLDTVNPDGYWWEPGTQSGEPSLSGVWVSNANAITPSGTKFSSYAGDQPLRGARCRVRKIDAAVPAAVAEHGFELRPKQHRRRAEVLAVAAELFSENGYEATSTTEIAERLGIKGGSVYYYIDSKEALLFELVEDIYGLLLESLEEVLASDADPVSKLNRLIDLHVAEWLDTSTGER